MRVFLCSLGLYGAGWYQITQENLGVALVLLLGSLACAIIAYRELS